MKKVVAFILISLILILSCSSVFALDFEDKIGTATYGEPLSIDGAWEDAYSYAVKIPFMEVDDTYAPNTTPNKCSGTMWLLWNEEFLYVYMEVLDPEMSNLNDGPSYLRDQITMFVDEDWQAGILDGVWESSIEDGYSIWVFEPIDDDTEAYLSEPAYENLFLAVADIDRDNIGFNAEFRIPWVQIVPEVGMKFGWEVQYNDDPGIGTRDHIITWGEGGEECLQWPGACGTIELVEAPEHPVEVEESYAYIFYIVLAALALLGVGTYFLFKKLRS